MRWLPVVGYEGIYEVSDTGRVRSLDRHDSRGRLIRGKERKLTQTQDGHLQITLHNGTRGWTLGVHHLVLTAFVGPRPDGAEGCHRNGDGTDNRVSNLRWGSRSSNVLDQVRHGVHNCATRQTCCRGHRLAEPNLMPSAARLGFRGCLACNRAHARARRHGERITQELADRIYAEILEAAL